MIFNWALLGCCTTPHKCHH